MTGERAYAVARRGDEVELKPRCVRIDRIEILSYSWPMLEVEVRCGKGTYIRSLARDLGDKVGCGALVQTLRRTRVGIFSVDAAVTLESDPAAVLAKLRSLADAVTELPRVIVSAEDADALRHGRSIRHDGCGEIAVFDETNKLLAIGEMDATQKRLRPSKGLPIIH